MRQLAAGFERPVMTPWQHRLVDTAFRSCGGSRDVSAAFYSGPTRPDLQQPLQPCVTDRRLTSRPCRHSSAALYSRESHRSVAGKYRLLRHLFTATCTVSSATSGVDLTRLLGGHERRLGACGTEVPQRGPGAEPRYGGSSGRPQKLKLFVKVHIIFALKYNKQQLLLLLDKITFIIWGDISMDVPPS